MHVTNDGAARAPHEPAWWSRTTGTFHGSNAFSYLPGDGFKPLFSAARRLAAPLIEGTKRMLKLLSALMFGTALLLGSASLSAPSYAQDDMGEETMSEEGMMEEAPADEMMDEAPADGDDMMDEPPAEEDPMEEAEEG
jgi:hypothetical protein